MKKEYDKSYKEKEKEIKIIGDDDYEYNIDEIEMIIIKNKLGGTFEFKPNEIKSIELITPITSN